MIFHRLYACGPGSVVETHWSGTRRPRDVWSQNSTYKDTSSWHSRRYTQNECCSFSARGRERSEVYLSEIKPQIIIVWLCIYIPADGSWRSGGSGCKGEFEAVYRCVAVKLDLIWRWQSNMKKIGRYEDDLSSSEQKKKIQTQLFQKFYV